MSTLAVLMPVALCNSEIGSSDKPGDGDIMYGTNKQGRTLQGPQLESIVAATDSRLQSWLQGPRLVGTLTTGRDQTTLAIASFRGREVIAHQRRRGGWSDETTRFDAEQLVGLGWTKQRCSPASGCVRVQFRIARASVDTARNTMLAHAGNRDVGLFEVEYRVDGAAQESPWINACGADGRGVFVDGQWSRDGDWTRSGFTFSCATGVIAKCARDWGYKPWKTELSPTGEEIDMGPLHRACVRAARADYHGDGQSHTRDGTRIALTDAHGLNTHAGGREFTLEAGFDERGAAWVLRPRRAPDDARLNTGPGARYPLIYVWSRPAQR